MAGGHAGGIVLGSRVLFGGLPYFSVLRCPAVDRYVVYPTSGVGPPPSLIRTYKYLTAWLFACRIGRQGIPPRELEAN